MAEPRVAPPPAQAHPQAPEPLLRVEDLTVSVAHEGARRAILDHVSFPVHPGEIVGLVGESGSGKSMTALAVMGLLPRAARLEGGRVWYEGRDVLALQPDALRAVRGSQIAMIFQNPRAALNPLMRAGHQVARVVRLHQQLAKDDAYEQAFQLLRRVGISDAETRARAYPHQLSGGMAQRVLIAMMLACQPRLLIADEPTTGLDVTIQAQIFELIKDLQAETGVTLLLITHDLGVVSEVCQRVVVMYGGQIMEQAATPDLFARPQHPYTQLLMRSVLRVDRPAQWESDAALTAIKIRYDIAGCRFANRCPLAREACWTSRPALAAYGGGVVACHAAAEVAP